MPTNTYVALARTTGDGSTATITFSSIPSTYTDLVIVANVTNSNGSDSLSLRFNGDTGSNYSYTVLGNNGSTAESYRSSNNTFMQVGMELDTALCPNIIQIMNYANTTTNKTVISRSGQGDFRTRANVGLWRSTSAITSITLRNPSGSGAYSTSSTFSLYGVAATSVGAKATGGYITADDQYYYHTFYSTGPFVPTQSLSCDYLVVAGGGGGGADRGGGGGAGGFRTSIGGSPLSLSATSYTITVGAGGAGGPYQANGSKGADSVFSSITATGGGFGGGTNSSGGTGGSGGGPRGGGAGTLSGGTGNQGGYSPVEGYNGGGDQNNNTTRLGGGGGGAGEAGNTDGPGEGGDGATSSFSGTSVVYAGGGGAGCLSGPAGNGGTGGGGAGATSGNGTAGTTNLGGGGGGGGDTGGLGGNGGSGLVIVRYAK